MRKNIFSICAAFILLSAGSAMAQTGAPFIHDPSTIVVCDGKYYTFGTGGGGLISEDGWHWEGGAVRPGGGAAPDAMKIGDRYLVSYSTTGGGMGGGHASSIMVMWNKTLDPNSPDFEYTEAVEVASSELDEDCNAIDTGLLLDPTTGRLWCTYGTYFGFIRQVELDPKTGLRVEGNEAIDIARNCEATIMIYRNGWYYLLGTHGTCCDGVNSTYNIVVGRSRSVNGPFIDNVGRSMLEGGGKMVINTDVNGRLVGPGHFGRFIVEDGVEKMSFHWEADMDQGGRSVLGIRPLLWKDDWPIAGEAFKDGTYEIQSLRSGYALELAVDFVRQQSGMRGFGANVSEPVKPLEPQSLQEVIGTWPEDEIEVRNGYYMCRPHQRWTIEALPEQEGYLGGAYYKIVIEGTDKALTASHNAQVVASEFTGADEQLWRIEQLTDGSFRIMPKFIPDCQEPYALVSLGDCSPTLAPFDFQSDNSKWTFKMITQ